MIGAFAAFDVDLEPAVAGGARPTARISFWLPTVPGGDRLLPAAPHGRDGARRPGRCSAAAARASERVEPTLLYKVK